MERFLKEAQLASEPWEKADIRSLIEVSVAANSKLYKKIRKESKDMGEAIQALFQEDIDKRVEADKDKLEKNTKNSIAKTMLEDGEPAEKILKYTGVEAQDLKDMAETMEIIITIPETETEGDNR